MELQAVFIDRDGTIGGTGHFIHPRDFILYEGALEAIHMLKGKGIKVFAFTNQHRISKQQATEEEFREQFLSFGFDDAFICPHGNVETCECRKPKPGMLHAAAAKYGLDLTKCAVIGDVGDTDILAAHAVGAIKVIVKTGWGIGSLTDFRSRWAEAVPDYTADDLQDAVKWLLSHANKQR